MLKKVLIASLLLTVLATSYFVPTAGAQTKCLQELETIGALAGSFVYTTYGYIGASADSYAKGNYSLEEIQAIMQEAANILDNVSGQLNGLKGLTSEDKTAVAHITLTCQYLKAEALAYYAYSNSESDADFQDFEKARNNAWAQIEALMGN